MCTSGHIVLQPSGERAYAAQGRTPRKHVRRELLSRCRPLVRSTPLYLLSHHVDDIRDLFESVRRQGFESLTGVS